MVPGKVALWQRWGGGKALPLIPWLQGKGCPLQLLMGIWSWGSSLPLLPFSPSSWAQALLDLEESCQGACSPAVLGSGRDFKGLLSWDPKLLPIKAHVDHQVTLHVVLSATQPPFAGWCMTFTRPLSAM